MGREATQNLPRFVWSAAISPNGSVFHFWRGGLGGFLEKAIQTLLDLPSVRMIRPQRFLVNRQSTPHERLGSRMVALRLKQQGQDVEAYCHIRVIRP